MSLLPSDGGWPGELPALVGGGLVLRAPREDDVPAMVAACQDPTLSHFIPVPAPYTRAHAEGFVRGSGAQWGRRNAANFAVCDETGGLLGMCSLTSIDRLRREAEVGFWVAPGARGRGVARTALGAVTGWAHADLGLARLWAEVEDANLASRRVVAAAGYVPVPDTFTLELRGTVRVMRRHEHPGH